MSDKKSRGGVLKNSPATEHMPCHACGNPQAQEGSCSLNFKKNTCKSMIYKKKEQISKLLIT
ncbi:hypothetical protein [Delftia sp. PS-11]|uniref:hypothetical protein n=1 Tax=Delftia sp. PS-11 TaxID=2767222 RepID=UPI002456526F|nr:hypothetical protein [Delftia sp. PS-11]KAJ8742655.1 hypothetical protein H9T68_19450 [Delftia sp. PS-11]